MIVKVCGLRDPDNIRAVERLPVDLCGFIFYPRSPRCVPDDEFHAAAVRSCRRPAVGVFVNASPAEMLRTAERFGLEWLQLHGDESPEACGELRQRGFRIIKAIRVASAGDLAAARAYEDCADYLLFDTRCDGYGGSGRRFDWSVLDAYAGRVPFLLSGGINPYSIKAIREFHHPKLAGIDINSRFETAPGQKDVARIGKFLQAIRTGETAG